MAVGVLDVDNVEGSLVTFPARDDADPPQVTTSGDHADIAGIELDEVVDLSGGNVDLDSVVGLDQRIWVANGATVVEHQVGNFVRPLGQLLDTAQFVLQSKERTGYPGVQMKDRRRLYSGVCSPNG